MMINISLLRKKNNAILAIGSHRSIIQSILDFDFLSGKKKPSIVGIIASGRNFERFFFGKHEVLLPVFSNYENIPKEVSEGITLILTLSSARRVLETIEKALISFPHLYGGIIFAEDVPEKHAITLSQSTRNKQAFFIGPASVGLLIPGILKLGAIGGTNARQIISSDLLTSGDIAVFSASGGMTNELISLVSRTNKRISFALSFGGDRFPITTPEDAFLAAEKDDATKTIIYYGELGGQDEYEIVRLLKEKKVTKEVICYIAGDVSELFETPPQFGHAKAMAGSLLETAKAKREALKKSGAKVADSFASFVQLLRESKGKEYAKNQELSESEKIIEYRRPGLITTSITNEENGEVTLLGENLLPFAKNNSFAKIASSLFLGKKIISKELESFIDFTFRLLVDHGPEVSGAMNTIVTARAGRDLASSLATGLLTIGPRFGGAINQAAENWLTGVREEKDPSDFVEEFAKRKIYISGIGHKKYRIDFPDPRVAALLSHADGVSKKRFTTFALAVQKVTSAKKGNLILNVDGAIAAVLLDILSEKEGFNDKELRELTKIEFFNGLFILSRSVGFMAHFFDQKRLDEGIFRLTNDMVAHVEKD